MKSSPAAVTTGIIALRNAYRERDVEAAEAAGPRERDVVLSNCSSIAARVKRIVKPMPWSPSTIAGSARWWRRSSTQSPGPEEREHARP